jgi:hypothetical protein
MTAYRYRSLGTKQIGHAPGHHERVAGDAAHALHAADQVHVRTDHGEVEPPAGADVAVADLAVMQRDAGIEIGVGCREPIEAVQRPQSRL